jgi:hypothetical protein
MANPTSITIGTNTYSLVSMPSTPAPNNISLVMHDTVADTQSPFTMQTQTQTWPGADWWEATISLPTMRRAQASTWLAFLAQTRGRECVFMVGDPSATAPLGFPRGIPVVNGSILGINPPTSTVLYTRGWIPSTHRLLLPGDYLQVGARLYLCLDNVFSDSSGDAGINIWPSIRETPPDGTPINFSRPQGLFRLSDNARTISADAIRLFGVSIRVQEVR